MSTDSERHDRRQASDVHVGRVLLVAFVCVAFLFVSLAVLATIYTAAVPGQRTQAVRTFPEPRLRPDETAQRQRILAEQRRRLEGYHWVDREKQIVAIPIERAMGLIAQRGADAYRPIEAPSASAKSGP